MIQIEMSKDIHDFSPKIISVFDKRQIVCIAIAGAYGLPFMLYATSVDIYTRITIAVVLMTPVVMCGWVNMYGMTLERFIWHIIKTRLFGSVRRYYATDNTFGYIDPTRPSAVKPALEKPIKRKRKERKKYRNDMIKYNGRR